MTPSTTDPDAGLEEHRLRELAQYATTEYGGIRMCSVRDTELLRAADTLAALRERAERAEVDARRWRYIRRFLDVDGDVTDPEGVTGTHVQWLIFNDEVPAQEGWAHTVESIVDAALSASPAPEVRDGS